MKKFLMLVTTIAILFFLNFPNNYLALAEKNSNEFYQEKTLHNSDGIGKFYLHREIAKVMGHQGMLWLERKERNREEKPDLLVQALELKSTDIVADIGSGTGYISFRLASLVNQGKVLAVDIQPEMLEVINFLKQENNVDNIETILGGEKTPNLPKETVDLAIMVDAYHEFAYPREMMAGIIQGLKPGGKVVLVEYRQENPFIAIKYLHKMSQKQIKKEMAAVGLIWQETKELLPQQHIAIFQKPN